MIEYSPIIIGRQIRKYRNAKKINQAELARLSEVSPTYISDLERGGKAKTKNSSPSMEILNKIANVLGVSFDDIVSTNLEIVDTKSTGILGEIDRELRNMSKEDITFINQLLPIFISTYNNKH